MSEETSETRWSFLDFEMFYDAKFGKKRLPGPQDHQAMAAAAAASYMVSYEQFGSQLHGGSSNHSDRSSNGRFNERLHRHDESGRESKQILVPLPEAVARRAMFEELLPTVPGEEALPYELLVERAEGFSGSDIGLACMEAALKPLCQKC